MPRLLSINNYYYYRGGAESVFLEQNKLFSDIGWQVVPFAMQHPDNLKSEWDRYFVDTIEFGNQYPPLQKLKNLSKIIYSGEARSRIRQIIDKARPDVAHAHNIYHHLSPSCLGVLQENAVPVVMTLHDLKLACPAYKMMTHDGICERCKGGAIWNVVANRCVKQSVALSMAILLESSVHKLLGLYTRNVDKFVVPSRFYLEKFVEWGFPREKFIYIPNFVDETRIKPGGVPGKAFVYFGRLGDEKGVATFIRAAAAARVEAWIVGSGPQGDSFKALARQLNANVTFYGYKTGEELLDIVRASRAVVLPSEWYENAPISVLEAYALQRPVIGSNIGGIPELIRDGETGAIFPSSDVAELTLKLQQFSQFTNDRILEMGEAGRQWVAGTFTRQQYRENLLQLYREIGVTVE